MKTIGNYYAYSTTVFDYIRRAMPFNMPRSLTDNEVYALTAYILSINKLIGDNDVIDAKSLPQVKTPNRDNYIIPYPDRIEMITWRRERRVRFGSKANVKTPNCDVRSTPKSGHVQCNSACPLCANSGRCKLYAITSAAALASRMSGGQRFCNRCPPSRNDW